MTHDNDLVPLEPIAKIVHHLKRVLLHLWRIHGSALKVFVIRRISLPRPPLIPFDHGEVLLQGHLKRARKRDKSDARTTVDEQKNWIVDVLASDLDPLVDTADAHGFEAVDALG